MSILDELAGLAPTPELRARRLERIAAAFAKELAPWLDPIAARYNEPLVEPIAGRAGWAELVKGPDPPANTSFTMLVTGDEVIKPLSVMCKFVSSGVAGTRTLSVEFRDDGGIAYAVTGAEVTISANETHHVCWYPEAGTPSWPVGADSIIAPLPRQFLYVSSSLVIVLGNGQAGDQISQVRVSTEKFQT